MGRNRGYIDQEHKKNRRRRRKTVKKLMQEKLLWFFLIIIGFFFLLSIRLFSIVQDKGESYKKQVLSHRSYESKTIPFRRGEILDRKGTRLAVSELAYNVVLDAKVMLADNNKYVEPTITAAKTYLGLNEGDIRKRLAEYPDSSYYIIAKELSYEQVKDFKELQADKEKGALIKGIWFEELYVRKYPNGTMACDVLGFIRSDNSGLFGLEQYYNEELSGTFGREYGYLNDNEDLERTTIAAVHGNSIVTTIDANIQGIVEKYLQEFDDEYKNNFTERNGSDNTGCIIMDVNTGEILAMASYPFFDPNEPKAEERIIGMPVVDEKERKTNEYLTMEKYAALSEDEKARQLNALWRNFCINDTYEPGSVAKPFTVAAALDTGVITGNEIYTCNGSLNVGGHNISCHNTYGDGPLTVGQSIERSCNVAMMKINEAMGIGRFVDYQRILNFGLKTNIDLYGESRTDQLIYKKENMRSADLATNSFGQGFNATMIQMMAGFCSLINGGNYYEPHMVSKIISPSGATVRNIEPRLLKQTVSASTSEKIKEYCNLVVTGEHGTGKTARPAGYMIGGKTGTAETLPRDNGEYVVSFMGYAPADDPEIAIYVVVDRPNVQYQDDAKFATRIVRKILTEVLPYLGLFMTEELSEEEQAELEAAKVQVLMNTETEAESGQAADTGQEAGSDQGDGAGQEAGTGGDVAAGGEEATEAGTGETTAEEGNREEVWKSFPIDPESGYARDPETGALVDPETGKVVSGGSSTPAGLGGDSSTMGDTEDDSPF